jgi:hypothetical protein
MKFSEAKNLLLLSGELINKYNFTVETIFIESDNYFGGLNHLWNIATNIETRFLVDLINSDFNTTYIIN